MSLTLHKKFYLFYFIFSTRSSKRKSPPTKHEGENATLEKCFEQVNNTSIDMKLEKNRLSFTESSDALELSLKKQRTNATTDLTECITRLPFEQQSSSSRRTSSESSSPSPLLSAENHKTLAKSHHYNRLNNNDENTVNNNQNNKNILYNNSEMKNNVIDITNPMNSTENLLISLSLGLVGSNFVQSKSNDKDSVNDNVINSKHKENSIADGDNTTKR